MYPPSSAAPSLEAIGYANTNPAAMATIPQEELKAAFVDKIDTTLFLQTPMEPALRDKLVEEFELIKSGF